MKKILLTLFITINYLFSQTHIPGFPLYKDVDECIDGDIYYINDMYVTEDEAKDQQYFIREEMKETLYGGDEELMMSSHSKFELLYNYSAFETFGKDDIFGILFDSLEASQQIGSTQVSWMVVNQLLDYLTKDFINQTKEKATEGLKKVLRKLGFSELAVNFLGVAITQENVRLVITKIIDYDNKGVLLKDTTTINDAFIDSFTKGHKIIAISFGQGNLFVETANMRISGDAARDIK